MGQDYPLSEAERNKMSSYSTKVFTFIYVLTLVATFVGALVGATVTVHKH